MFAPLALVQANVHRHVQHPSLECAASPKRIQLPVNSDKSLLASILRVLSITEYSVARPIHDGLVAPDQFRKRSPATVTGLLHQRTVVQLFSDIRQVVTQILRL